MPTVLMMNCTWSARVMDHMPPIVGVYQDDGAADGDGQPALPAEEDNEDGGVGARGGGAQHQGVGQHDDAGGLCGLLP